MQVVALVWDVLAHQIQQFPSIFSEHGNRKYSQKPKKIRSEPVIFTLVVYA